MKTDIDFLLGTTNKKKTKYFWQELTEHMHYSLRALAQKMPFTYPTIYSWTIGKEPKLSNAFAFCIAFNELIFQELGKKYSVEELWTVIE